MRIRQYAEDLIRELSHFPWRHTALTLRDRFREDHMGLTASSLTFTTSIALVPFFTVALALFTAFPMFTKMQVALQSWLVQSLIPDNIARQVLGYLTQFSRQANKLGGAGLAVLLITATAMILTIDRTLNAIWRVRKPRPLAHRVLMYWAAITLGPLLFAASLVLTSYLVSSTRGLVGTLPFGVGFMLNLAQFALVAGAVALLFRYVPNTFVKWSHASVGGIFVAAGIELAKKALSLYLSAMPTYSLVYGAFATLPILLVWIYVSWVIVLMGAVIAAYLPSLLAGIPRRGGAHGWHFQLAIEVLQQLDVVQRDKRKGLTGTELAERLQVDALQLEPVLETLLTIEWLGQLSGLPNDGQCPYLLMVNPDSTPLEPLLDRLLLGKSPSVGPFWGKAGWSALKLRDAI
jgi:membrane protein